MWAQITYSTNTSFVYFSSWGRPIVDGWAVGCFPLAPGRYQYHVRGMCTTCLQTKLLVSQETMYMEDTNPHSISNSVYIEIEYLFLIRLSMKINDIWRLWLESKKIKGNFLGRNKKKKKKKKEGYGVAGEGTGVVPFLLEKRPPMRGMRGFFFFFLREGCLSSTSLPCGTTN